MLAYGSIIRNPADPQRFVDSAALQALQKKGLYADQRIAIAPIRTAKQASLENDPLLKKDIRFYFQPNSAALDNNAKENTDFLDTIKRFLQVSPGSTVLLRGHVDNARIDEFRQSGGESSCAVWRCRRWSFLVNAPSPLKMRWLLATKSSKRLASRLLGGGGKSRSATRAIRIAASKFSGSLLSNGLRAS